MSREQHPEELTSSPSPDDTLMNKIARNKVFTVVIIGLILLAALWIIKDVQLRSVRRQALQTAERTRAEVADASIRVQEDHLRVLAKPFVWAVRTQMLRGNLSQLDLYLNEMIREKSFQLILVTDERGQVVSSTDKKLEGSLYSDSLLLQSDTTLVQRVGDSLLLMSSPVMGFNSRIGTLVARYKISFPQLALSDEPDSTE